MTLEMMYWNVVFSFALVDLALVAALLVSDLGHNHFKISDVIISKILTSDTVYGKCLS